MYFKWISTCCIALVLAACGGGGGGSPPTFNLTFEPEAGVPGQVTGLRFRPDVRQDFTVQGGVTVTGQIRDGNGNTLANVRVSFRTSPGAPNVARDDTDEGGNYSVTLAPGTWEAVVESESDALGTRIFGGNVVATPGPVTFDFSYPAGLDVTGTVLDSLAAPTEADIEFVGRTSGVEIEVTANGAGLYAASLPPDTYDAVVSPRGAARSTHLRQRFRSIVVTSARTRDFDLTPGVTVSGFVLTNLSAPLGDEADVEAVLPEGSDFLPPAGVESDEDTGAYSIGPVPIGNVTFRIEPDNDSGFPEQEFTRSVAGPATENEDFLLEPGLVLSGTIYRDDGTTPQDNVEVKPDLLSSDVPIEDDETDGNGRYSISLFPGTYDITFTPRRDSRHLPLVRRIVITQSTVLDITLVRGALVQGRVFLPGSSTPARNVRVEIPGVLGASDVSEDDGDYAFLAPAGVHTLVLTALSGAYKDIPLDPRTGVLVSIPGPLDLNLSMVPSTDGSTVVTGIVYDTDGVTPLPNAEIVARRDGNGDMLSRAVSDANGNYTLVIR